MDHYRIGVIVRPHGVRGGVKLLPLTDDEKRFLSLTNALLEQGGAYSEIELSNIKVSPGSIIVNISGISTREQAEALNGAYIAVKSEDARALPEYTWFIADLIGCEVYDETGKRYGVIKDVLKTGANDVYELDCGMLIPALKSVLREVSTENKRMVCNSAVLKEVAVFAD